MLVSFSLEFSRLAISAKTQSYPPDKLYQAWVPQAHIQPCQGPQGPELTLEPPAPVLMCPRTWSHQTAGQHHARDTSASNIRTDIAHTLASKVREKHSANHTVLITESPAFRIDWRVHSQLLIQSTEALNGTCLVIQGKYPEPKCLRHPGVEEVGGISLITFWAALNECRHENQSCDVQYNELKNFDSFFTVPKNLL